MKKKAEKDRYVLMVKYWIEGKESEALEGTMAANSLGRHGRNSVKGSGTSSTPPRSAATT